MTSHSYALLNLVSQAEISRQIEQFVQAIQASSEPAYNITVDPEGLTLFHPTALALDTVQLKLMYDFIAGLDAEISSEVLRGFQEACQDVGIEFSSLVGMTCLDEDECRYLGPEETLNLLVARTRLCRLKFAV